MSVREVTQRMSALLVGIAVTCISFAQATRPVTEADLERARRSQPSISDHDIEAARQRHRMPTDAELARVPVPAPPKLDALPKPTADPKIDLEAIVRGYAAIDANRAPGLPQDEPALLVFVSFSMPEATLSRLIDQAARARATLILRGLVNHSLNETVVQVQRLIGTRALSFQIDPLAFDRFGIARVPAFVLVARGAPAQPCSAGTCVAADAFAAAFGDVSLDYALEYLSRSAPRFSADAAVFLKRLRG